MFLHRYNDRSSTLKIDHETVIKETNDDGSVKSERRGTVHSLNDFDITVWEDGEVTARRKYYATSDPRKHFPNMEVSGGSISLPIEDLVSFILERIKPAELAEGLIADTEVREQLIYALAHRYGTDHVTDTDRRKFLTEVKEAVHSKALDAAVTALNRKEDNLRSNYDYYRWKKIELGHYKSIYEYVCMLLGSILKDDPMSENRLVAFKNAHIAPDKLEEYIRGERDPVVMESVGAQWRESRDYWRRRLEELFPAPVQEPAPVAPADEIPF